MESYSQKTEKIMKVFSRFSDDCIMDLPPPEYNKAYTYIAECLLEFELEKIGDGQLRARNAELEAEVSNYKDYVGDSIFMSDYQTVGHIREAIRDIEAEVARLRNIAESALEGLYNGFEPDNQSARYKKIKAALEASDG